VPADKRIRIAAAVLVLALVGAAVWYLRGDHGPRHFTGFVEGEERVIRSEVSGRVLEVKYAEGAEVPADTAIAVIDDTDIAARIRSKEEEVRVLDAEIVNQKEKIVLTETTWQRDVSTRAAELRQAEAAAELARRTLARNAELFKKGTSTAQEMDESRAREKESESGVTRARELLARAQEQEREIALAGGALEALRRRRDLAAAQLHELHVTRAKHVIRSPSMPTVVQTQFLWPGELAQPGTPVLALLDPVDKYVQLYVPVAALGEVRVGQRVALELDSEPGRRYPGEISFIADRASFTPEKIETRSDRMTQVYRVKVRVLDGVERLRPGTEGNVYIEVGRNGGPG
jgi:HlyD family secretion protein